MGKHLSLSEAIDDFAEHVEPALFPEGRKKNRDYYRVKNLLYARKAEKEGRTYRRPITVEWVEGILSEFAPGRYTFTHHTIVTLNEET